MFRATFKTVFGLWLVEAPPTSHEGGFPRPQCRAICSRSLLLVPALLLMAAAATASGQEYSVETISASPPGDVLSDDLAKQFGETGYRIKKGASRTVCEIWLRKELEAQAGFEASPTMLYALTPGQLIGVIHYPRRGKDFRDQSIASGWYTLRFFLQPVDGNHIGTSPTRDFLLLVAADKDSSGKDWDESDLQRASAEAAGSSHPAMLCLQAASEGPEAAVRHQESQDWWIAHLPANGKSGDKLALDVVVEGHAAE